MKYFNLLSLAILALTFTACSTGDTKAPDSNQKPVADMPTTEAPVTYSVLTDESIVKWKGMILNVKSHEGTMKFDKGELTVLGDNITKGKFVVDMTSMLATDENYDPENGQSKEALIGHLQSEEFFDTENYPKAILSILDGKATLTVRGKAKAVELKNMKISRKDGVLTASASMMFNRQDFGVSYSGAKEYIISDDVTTFVEISAKKL